MWTFTRDWSLALGLTAVRVTLLQPFERIKLEITFFQKSFGRQCTSLSDLLRSVTKKRGILIWWKHGLTAFALVGPVVATILALNDRLLALLPAYNAQDEFVRSLGAKFAVGACAGAIGHGLMHPIQMANYRSALAAQARARGAAGPAPPASFRDWLQLMRGEKYHFTGTVGVAALYRGGQLGVFYQLQDVNPWVRDRGFAGVSSTFLAAMAGHFVATSINHPFDTVRRRIMFDQERPLFQREFTGIVDCFRKIATNEGVRGLTHGIRSKFIFGAIGQSTVLMAYDRIKAFLDSDRDNHEL